MAESDKPRVVAVIPARLASTRFPGKVIAPLLGHPLVYHTWQQVNRAQLVDQIIVATDDNEVVEALAPYPVEVVLTDPEHATGSDRIAEVARTLDAALIVNVQGDEPVIDPETIDAAIRPLLTDSQAVMSTARRALDSPESIQDTNVVKVVCGADGNALYFSRLPIPYYRDGGMPSGTYWQHIGLYVYRREFLLAFSALAPTPLEQAEKLEQLRVLEHGFQIVVVTTRYNAIGVDVPADLKKVEELLQHNAAKG